MGAAEEDASKKQSICPAGVRQYRNGRRADVAAVAAVVVDSRSEEVLPAKAQPAEVDVATLLR